MIYKFLKKKNYDIYITHHIRPTFEQPFVLFFLLFLREKKIEFTKEEHLHQKKEEDL